MRNPQEFNREKLQESKCRICVNCDPRKCPAIQYALYNLFLQLAPIRLTRYGEDLLFYLYYCNGGDLMQVLAASEL